MYNKLPPATIALRIASSQAPSKFYLLIFCHIHAQGKREIIYCGVSVLNGDKSIPFLMFFFPRSNSQHLPWISWKNCRNYLEEPCTVNAEEEWV
jgi:hypothetical protein